jgi:hypothetical protein
MLRALSITLALVLLPVTAVGAFPPPEGPPYPTPQPTPFEVVSSSGRVTVRGAGVEASADRLTLSSTRDCFVLEGNVEARCERAAIRADRIVIHLTDGRVEVGAAPPQVPTPPTPVVQPCRTGVSTLTPSNVPQADGPPSR